jgi:hypothetical protein
MRLVRSIIVLLFTACLGVQATSVHAAGAEVRSAGIIQTDEGVILNGSFSLKLTPALIDAVNHGIPLVFQMEAELKRSRWYWIDEIVYRARVDRRLTYNVLVRNYRVTDGVNGRNFVNLNDAIAYIARSAEWRLPSEQARTGDVLDVAMRFRLDPAFLPKPFQVVSFGDRDWRIDSDWRTFHLTVPAVAGGK